MYLKRGLGEYDNIEHGDCTSVKVEEVQEIDRLKEPHLGLSYGSIIRVSFFGQGQRIRYVDFCILASGAGGEPFLRVVECP